MREGVFILFVLFLLFGLTALRYRKQIAAILDLGRTIREMKEGAAAEIPLQKKEAAPAARELRSCTGCGKWIDTSTAIKFDQNTFYCSRECVRHSTASS